jgi:hypothetical protein
LSLVIWWSPSRERVCSEAVCPRPPLFVSLSLLMPETSADFAFRFWWTFPIQLTSAHASMHHSFCCANYKNSKSKYFKQSRKLSIMLICPLVRKKERKKENLRLQSFLSWSYSDMCCDHTTLRRIRKIWWSSNSECSVPSCLSSSYVSADFAFTF